MKVDITDLIWAAVSMFIVGYSYLHGWLIYGVILIYVLMTMLFFMHIARIRAVFSRSVAVYGKIKGYHEEDKGYHVYPIVTYTTEDGRDITSTYTVRSRKKLYEHGDEYMICYDSENPMFFYFPDRENDFIIQYKLSIYIGGVIAVILLIAAQIM